MKRGSLYLDGQVEAAGARVEFTKAKARAHAAWMTE